MAAAAAQAGDPDRASRLAADAEALAHAITDPDAQTRALTVLAAAAAQAGDPDRASRLAADAEALAYAITDPHVQAQALAEVVTAIALAGDPDGAATLARATIGGRDQARALTGAGLCRRAGQLRSDNAVVQSLDRVRLAAWKQKDQAGFYLTPMLRAYFYWDPRIHHEGTEKGGAGKLDKLTGGRNVSAAKCIQRTWREHDDLVAEFETILKGVEQTLNATGMAVRRLTDEEMFLELKRAMNPLLR